MTSENEELKPCVFCGSTPRLFPEDARFGDPQAFECGGCGMSGPKADRYQIALESWNRLAGLQQRAEEAEAERDAADRDRQWIIAEQAPNPWQVVLGWASYQSTPWSKEYPNIELCYREPSGKWWVLNNGDYVDGEHGRDYKATVTHWMPLPVRPGQTPQ